MTDKPKLIAISQRNEFNRHGDPVDTLENSYVNYYEQFGIRLLPIPNSSSDVDYYLSQFPIDGVILSGGNTVNPELYGGQRDPDDTSVSDLRDATEKKLLEYAISHNIPVLGICRGFQFINVYFGGSLIENVHDLPGSVKHVASVHPITLTDPTFSSFFGEQVEVNSYHNNGIGKSQLSSELKLLAQSKDGIVEAFCHPKYPIVGIEWHPERKSPDKKFNAALLHAFVNKELYWSQHGGHQQ